MNKQLQLIKTDMNYHDLQELLKHSEEYVFPLVNNKEERIFLCQIQRFALERHLFKQELAYRKLVVAAEDSDTSSSDDENVMGIKLKNMGISIESDLERNKLRKKQEKKRKKTPAPPTT